jgi:hypothetical protein
MQRVFAGSSVSGQVQTVNSGLKELNHVEAGKGVDAARGHSLTPQKALQRLICFFGILLIAIFSMNSLVSTGLRRVKTSAYGAWNQAMQGEVNADVIISGSSRAAYHYDPRTIETLTGRSAFNIGRAGSQTDVQLAVLKAYLEHNRKPRLIVHNLDAFSFVSSRKIYDPALYVPYLSDKEIYGPLAQIEPDIAKSRYLPLYGYVVEDMGFTWIQGLKALVGISPKQDYFLGFSPRDYKWSDDFSNFKAGNPHGVSFAIEPSGVRALEQLIEVCRKNGIPLVFVYSPEFIGMQEMTNNRAEIFAQFQELASRYHVPLWDYSNWKFDGDRDFFYNSQHLNAPGAALFSEDLANRLQNYFSNRDGSGNYIEASGVAVYPNGNEN